MVFDKDEKKKGKAPNYSSREGVQIWENKDKNDKTYLSVRIPILNISVNCFAVEPKQKEE